MSDTITLPLHEVSINAMRGNTVFAVQVPEYEVDVLRVLHMPANVVDNGVGEDEGEYPASASAEYARLERKYRQPGKPNPVGAALRMGPSGLKQYGFALGGPVAEEPQAAIRKRPKPKKAEAKKKAE